MKKLIAMMLAGAMLFAATGCSSDNGGSTEDAVAKYGSDTLKLYNWGEYMGEKSDLGFRKGIRCQGYRGVLRFQRDDVHQAPGRRFL